MKGIRASRFLVEQLLLLVEIADQVSIERVETVFRLFQPDPTILGPGELALEDPDLAAQRGELRRRVVGGLFVSGHRCAPLPVLRSP